LETTEAFAQACDVGRRVELEVVGPGFEEGAVPARANELVRLLRAKVERVGLDFARGGRIVEAW
jgi:hypothetical protein